MCCEHMRVGSHATSGDHPADDGMNNHRPQHRKPDPARAMAGEDLRREELLLDPTSRTCSTRSARPSTYPLRPPKPARPPLPAAPVRPQPAAQACPALARAGDGPAGPRQLHRAKRSSHRARPRTRSSWLDQPDDGYRVITRSVRAVAATGRLRDKRFARSRSPAVRLA